MWLLPNVFIRIVFFCKGLNDGNAVVSLLQAKNHEDLFGPPINEIVSKKFETLFSECKTNDGTEVLKDKLLQPENAKFLCVPKVNPEIWINLSQKARSADLKLQCIQKGLLKGIVAMSNTCDQFLAHNQDLEAQFVEPALNNIMLGAEALVHTFLAISSKRRAEIKPNLDRQYAGICAAQSHGEYLFGSNIVESLKASKSVAGVIKNAVTGNKRFAPYKTTRNLNFKRPSFRGSGWGRQLEPQQRQQQSQWLNRAGSKPNRF